MNTERYGGFMVQERYGGFMGRVGEERGAKRRRADRGVAWDERRKTKPSTDYEGWMDFGK